MRFEKLIALLLLVIALTQSQGVSGCGGSIKASPAIMKYSSNKSFHHRVLGNAPNFSDITVSLLTSDGVIQEQIVCSPQGYFFIPMYDIVFHFYLPFMCRVNTVFLSQRRTVGV